MQLERYMADAIEYCRCEPGVASEVYAVMSCTIDQRKKTMAVPIPESHMRLLTNQDAKRGIALLEDLENGLDISAIMQSDSIAAPTLSTYLCAKEAYFAKK